MMHLDELVRLRRAGALLAVCVLLGAETASANESTSGAAVVRGSNARLWQTDFDPGAPLSWRWQSAATSASVLVSNLVARTATGTAVVRGLGEAYGAFALAVADLNAECLYDLVLVQKNGGGETISTEAARVAVLPGVGASGCVVVQEFTEKPWKTNKPVVVAYDGEWSGTMPERVDLTVTTETGADSPYLTDAKAGYEAFDMKSVARGQTTATLDLLFDDAPCASAIFNLITLGMTLIVR